MKTSRYLFIPFIFLFFAGCKYEDGPAISFRTACDRVKGEWVIESLYVDGADSLEDFQTKQIYCLTYKFDIDGSNLDLYGYDCIGGISNTNHNFYNGGWELHNNNKKISFGLGNSGLNYGPLFHTGEGNLLWTIIRLTNKEMWLKITYFNNKVYEVNFKSK